jgi:hypothetical protein
MIGLQSYCLAMSLPDLFEIDTDGFNLELTNSVGVAFIYFKCHSRLDSLELFLVSISSSVCSKFTSFGTLFFLLVFHSCVKTQHV